MMMNTLWLLIVIGLIGVGLSLCFAALVVSSPFGAAEALVRMA